MKKRDLLEELLDPEKRVEVKLESVLREMDAPNEILVVIESHYYSAVQTGLLSFLEKKYPNGVFVSANKPLVNLFEDPEAIIKNSNILFVDLVSDSAGTDKIRGSNIKYLESPKNLLELTLEIEKGLKEMPAEKKFVITDSLSTLLLYNRPESVEKFVRNLTGKIRGLNTFGVFLMIKSKENADAIRVISQFCDHTIEIDETRSETR